MGTHAGTLQEISRLERSFVDRGLTKHLVRPLANLIPLWIKCPRFEHARSAKGYSRLDREPCDFVANWCCTNAERKLAIALKLPPPLAVNSFEPDRQMGEL
jgi:hypothetical protein